MAGRPEKYTISYFPHYVKDSRTLYTLENEYAAEGYMFWFKLLEFLCNSPGLSYDCSEPANFKYLCAKTKVMPELANKIMDTLSDLNKIDKELWQHRIIWCQQLVDNVEDVFKRRKADMPLKPISVNINSISVDINPINVELLQHDVNINGINVTQRKENEIKLNNNHIPYGEIVDLYNLHCSKLTKCIDLTDKRKTTIRNRYLDHKRSTEYFIELFKAANTSDFLCGEVTKWKANFDWIMNENNMIKVLEGQFTNKTQSNLTGEHEIKYKEYIPGETIR